MEKATVFEEKLMRIFAATRAKGDTALAKILGIKAPSVAAARKRRQIPTGWVEFVAEKYGISADWLFFGRGPMHLDDAEAQPPAPMQATPETTEKSPDKTVRRDVTVPVLGLAACGVSGWYNPGPLAIRAPVPIAHPNAENFIAVIAVGTSMQPDGIRQGYLLFCDPGAAPREGDAVFVKQYDERVSIKKYISGNDAWVCLQGWLEPDDDGFQKAYTEKICRDAVKEIAPVILVQRRA